MMLQEQAQSGLRHLHQMMLEELAQPKHPTVYEAGLAVPPRVPLTQNRPSQPHQTTEEAAAVWQPRQ